MKTETLSTKIIKWFYNIHGPLDEYRLNETNRIGNTIAIGLTLFDLILAFTAGLIVLVTDNYELACTVVVSALILIVFVIGGYVLYKTSQLHLSDVEIEEQQVTSAKRQVIKQAITSSLYFAIMAYVIDIITDWLPERGPLLPLLANHSTIGIAIFSGLIFGLMISLIDALQIKVFHNYKDNAGQSYLTNKRWILLPLILIILGLLTLHAIN